jgi:hypothetical protein
MQSRPVDEETITAYLLGELSEAETERLDEMSVTDDAFAERLLGVENDLVDSYIRGELSGDTLARLKSHYLTSPRRRAKVRFAETLVAFADRPVAVQVGKTGATDSASSTGPRSALREPSGWHLFALRGRGLEWGLAAAALVILLAAGYSILENARLRAQMTHTKAEREALEQREQELQQQLAQQRSSDAETKKELSRVRDRLAQLEQQLAAGQTGRKGVTGQRDLNIIAFNLAPQSRGVGQIATIAVPADTDYVALTLALEADDFPAYQAALRDPATGQIIWRSGRLKTSGQSKTVRVSLRASLLKPQNYILEVTGITRSGAAEFIGGYPVRVVIQ